MNAQLSHLVVPGAILIVVVFVASLMYDTRNHFEMGKGEYCVLSWISGIVAFIGLMTPMMTTSPNVAVTGLGVAAVFGFIWLVTAVLSGNPGPLFNILIRLFLRF